MDAATLAQCSPDFVKRHIMYNAESRAIGRTQEDPNDRSVVWVQKKSLTGTEFFFFFAGERFLHFDNGVFCWVSFLGSKPYIRYRKVP